MRYIERGVSVLYSILATLSVLYSTLATLRGRCECVIFHFER